MAMLRCCPPVCDLETYIALVRRQHRNSRSTDKNARGRSLSLNTEIVTPRLRSSCRSGGGTALEGGGGRLAGHLLPG
jgi:hypothetical protein|eukprot:COSAG01_NODE_7543_length_3158_cov_1.837856_4_plen_77_part_00